MKGYCGICDSLSRRILVEDEVSQVSCIRIDGQLTEDGYSLADVDHRRKETLRPWVERLYTHSPLPAPLLQSSTHLSIFMVSWECQLLCLTSDELKGAALSQCKARLEETEMHGFRMLVSIFLPRESHIMEMDHHCQRAKYRHLLS